MQPLLLIAIVLVLFVIVLALAAEPYYGRLLAVLQGIFLVLAIVALLRYLGWV